MRPYTANLIVRQHGGGLTNQMESLSACVKAKLKSKAKLGPGPVKFNCRKCDKCVQFNLDHNLGWTDEIKLGKDLCLSCLKESFN